GLLSECADGNTGRAAALDVRVEPIRIQLPTGRVHFPGLSLTLYQLKDRVCADILDPGRRKIVVTDSNIPRCGAMHEASIGQRMSRHVAEPVVADDELVRQSLQDLRRP